MSYRSRRTKTNGDQALMQPDISSPDIESQPRTHPPLQREERQPTKTKHLGLTKHSAPLDTISKPVAKKPRVLPSNLDSNSRPTRGVSITTLRDKVPSARPHVEERSQPTNVQQKFTFPPHLDPSFVRVSQKSRPSISINANLEERSQPIEVSRTFTQPSRSQQSDIEPPRAGVEAQDIDDHMRDVAESETESLEQGNEQGNVRKSKSTRARTMKSRTVPPNWTEPLNIDDKEDILTIDAEKNQKILSGSIQPRDIDNLEDGVRCIVNFNEFDQPIRKAGFVLVKYLGSLGKLDKFCPIGANTWHDVHALYKADLIKRVREKFVIPSGIIFDKAILMRVAKYWRHYKYTLKVSKFDPDKRTKKQIINDVPPGHTKDNWMRLVEYWYTLKSQNLSSVGKEARASQSHVHTTGCISYANKRADFVESTGKQPSHLEFFQMTHTKVAGGFVDNTISSQFLV